VAREIVVTHQDAESRFTFSKLSREQLYGGRRRIVLDTDGAECQRAQLTNDGSLLLTRGMLGQGYFDKKGGYVETASLVGIVADGSTVERHPATLNAAQPLSAAVEPTEVLDLHVTTVYRLQAEELESALEQELDQGAIFRFPLNYQADFQVETAYLLKNGAGIFALVGVPVSMEWTEPAAVVNELFESEETEVDEIDFDMM
jgi:hemin uptake protein HemP